MSPKSLNLGYRPGSTWQGTAGSIHHYTQTKVFAAFPPISESSSPSSWQKFPTTQRVSVYFTIFSLSQLFYRMANLKSLKLEPSSRAFREHGKATPSIVQAQAPTGHWNPQGLIDSAFPCRVSKIFTAADATYGSTGTHSTPQLYLPFPA